MGLRQDMILGGDVAVNCAWLRRAAGRMQSSDEWLVAASMQLKGVADAAEFRRMAGRHFHAVEGCC
jgi:hypothetical protein